MDKSIKPYFSIAIPTWEINGLGSEYLEHSFNILAQQTFTNFEVVISDHSQDNKILELCETWNFHNLLNIKYYRNIISRGKIAPNMNNAIKNSTGSYIKILSHDDFLYDIDSIQIIYDHIQKHQDCEWIVTGCTHTDDTIIMYDKMIPYYHDKIYQGINTISCPTVLTIKNHGSDTLLLRENLNWLLDCCYYKDLYDKYGLPCVIEDICAVNRNAEVRTTTMTTELQKQQELELVNQIYDTIR